MGSEQWFHGEAAIPSVVELQSPLEKLEIAGSALVAAAMRYKQAARDAGIRNVILWVQENDKLVICCDNRWKQTLLRSIEPLGRSMQFGSSNGGENGEAGRDEGTPGTGE